jgi:large subunit ribosomal protein L21
MLNTSIRGELFMYAIIEIADKQFQVTKDDLIKIPLLKKEVGEKIELDKVLFYSDGSKVKIGKPLLKGAKVSAEVIEHGRDKKIIVFKKKRRKGFKVKNGHRQHFTKIKINNLSA